MNFAMGSAPRTGRVAAIALPPPSLTNVASACSTAINCWRLPVAQACRHCRTISSDSRRDAVKRGRESRRRARARVRICRVFAWALPMLLAITSKSSSNTSRSRRPRVGRRELVEQRREFTGRRRDLYRIALTVPLLFDRKRSAPRVTFRSPARLSVGDPPRSMATAAEGRDDRLSVLTDNSR